MSFSSGCPHAESSEALVAPMPLRIMNSRRFIIFGSGFRVQGSEFGAQPGTTNPKPGTRFSSMADVAVNAHASRAVAVHAPSHRLLDFATHAVHLPDLSVTCGAFEPGSNVRLVRVESVRFRFKPVDAAPRRLLLARGEGRELLNLGAVGLDRFVTTHARIDVGNRRVRRLVCVLVTERAFELRAVFFGHVLPVIKLNRLFRRYRLCRRAQEYDSDNGDRDGYDHCE